MRVLIPLPDKDFDVTEVAVLWRVLLDAGHQVVFATEDGGNPPECDPKRRNHGSSTAS
jgi:putative intracellular protease/amidase